MPSLRPFLRASQLASGLILALVAGIPANAVAQTGACESYRAQLAALERSANSGGAGPYEAAARRQRGELERTLAYGRQLGCDRRPALFFGSPPPPECSSVNARIAQMRANLRDLEGQAAQMGGGPAFQQRRAQLMAAIDQSCRAAPNQAAPRNLFEALFGVPRDAVRPPSTLPELDPLRDADIDPLTGEPRKRLGGNRPVCVRACDGFFFPLPTSPGGRDGMDEMCQALCPGTATSAYFMSPTGNIQEAVSARGEPYTSLANAGKYLKTVDPACTCRKPDQSWAEVLREAESMLTHRRGDILVNEAKAEELSRLKIDPKGQPQSQAANRPAGRGQTAPNQTAAAPSVAPAAPAATDAPATPPSAFIDLRNPRARAAATGSVPADPAVAEQAASGEAAPTASQDSAGIGPKTIEGAATVGQAAGNRRDILTPEGEKRNVRVIGNGLTPIPR